MNRVLDFFVRFVVIVAGYLVASLVASTFLNIVFFASAGFRAEDVPMLATGSIVFSIPFVALFVAYFAFIPSVPAILLAEFLGMRDWLFYAIAGGVVGLVVIGFFWHAAGPMYAISDALNAPAHPSGPDLATIDPVVVFTVIGGGIVGGFGYWLVAGRMAGPWRRESGGATSPAP